MFETNLLIEFSGEVGKTLSRLEALDVYFEGRIGGGRREVVRYDVQRIDIPTTALLVLDARLEDNG